ncbi:hypothetical protein [Pseudomonas sp. PDM04]|uniref:hypothetical protein n=1 Tax=Pseudomonas sp. PDM04 TaxID=2769296 RepID=UPI00177E6AC2|nr:hypothetical protein [Pseudomonas sp. PDM04]MBD9438928.1 hypothetical protein [Pseudomonas sp. PDM04]
MTASSSSNPSQSPDDTEASILLTILRINDPDGINIIGRTFYKASYKIIGNGAEPNQDIFVYNVNEKLGEATSDSVGAWETPMLDVKTLDCYNIRAVGQWGTGPVAAPKKFTAATLTPTINEVLSDGKPIADNDSIRETSVTLNGNAVPNQDVEAFNGETSLETQPANECGKYSIELTGLTPATYRIKVKGSNDNESTVFNFTVLAAIELVTLDRVTDVDGNEIPKGSATTKTSLRVEGAGEKGEKIEVFDGSDSLGEATVDPATGRYQHPIGPLTPKGYSLTSVALYTDGGTSDPYPLTVEVNNAPYETRVHDANAEIVDNGSTSSSWVKVSGKTEPLGAVKIKVNDTVGSKTEEANDQGAWATLITSLQVGTTYVVSAVAADDEDAESNSITFTRTA